MISQDNPSNRGCQDFSQSGSCPTVLVEYANRLRSGLWFQADYSKYTPVNLCTFDQDNIYSPFSGDDIGSAVELDRFYANNLESSLGGPLSGYSQSCFGEASGLERPTDSQQKAMVSFFYIASNRFKNGMIQNLDAISAIDSAMGFNKLVNVKCEDTLYPEVRKHCEELKGCDSSSDTLPALVDEVDEALSAISYLELMKSQVKSSGMIGKGRLDKRATKSIKELDARIKLIEDTSPWIKGSAFKDAIGEIKRAKDERARKGLIIKNLRSQMRATKSALTDQLNKHNNATLCLRGLENSSEECEDFKEMVDSKSYVTRINYGDDDSREFKLKAIQSNQYLSMARCMLKQSQNRDDSDEVMRDAAVTGALSLVPMGGGLALRGIAMGAKAQRYIRTAGAGALLAADGAYAVQGSKKAMSECEVSLNKLTFHQDDMRRESDICRKTDNPRGVKLTRDVKSCVVSAAMAGLDFLPFIPAAGLMRVKKSYAKRGAKSASEIVSDKKYMEDFLFNPQRVTGKEREQFLKQSGSLSDSQRIALVEEKLLREGYKPLSDVQKDALLDAHYVGSSRGAGYGSYSAEEIQKKGMILKSAKFDKDTIRWMMDRGVTGQATGVARSTSSAVDTANHNLDMLKDRYRQLAKSSSPYNLSGKDLERNVRVLEGLVAKRKGELKAWDDQVKALEKAVAADKGAKGQLTYRLAKARDQRQKLAVDVKHYSSSLEQNKKISEIERQKKVLVDQMRIMRKKIDTAD